MELDNQAKIVTIDQYGISKNTYELTSVSGSIIWNELVLNFPNVAEYPATLETISKVDDTISLTYKELPRDDIKERFGIRNTYLVDKHTIKYELDTKKAYLKIYTNDFWHNPIPSLPDFSSICTNYGIGRYYGKLSLENRRSLYFLNKQTYVDIWADNNDLYVHDELLPEQNLILYGLEYEIEDTHVNILSLKRYYP